MQMSQRVFEWQIGSFDFLSQDEDSTPSLWEAVVSRVDYAPFRSVAEVGKAPKDDCEVAASLRSGRLQQPVDVLKEKEARLFQCEQPVYLPPQDALLPDDAMGLAKDLC